MQPSEVNRCSLKGKITHNTESEEELPTLIAQARRHFEAVSEAQAARRIPSSETSSSADNTGKTGTAISFQRDKDDGTASSETGHAHNSCPQGSIVAAVRESLCHETLQNPNEAPIEDSPARFTNRESTTDEELLLQILQRALDIDIVYNQGFPQCPSLNSPRHAE